jgi:hypothetical protein
MDSQMKRNTSFVGLLSEDCTESIGSPNSNSQMDELLGDIETPQIQISHDRTIEFVEFIQRHLSIKNSQTHSQLQSDLIEHLWQLYGQS